jgi:glycosyltransferase XagB
MTYTDLASSLSAKRTFTRHQIFWILSFIVIVICGLFILPLQTIRVLISFISVLYFIDTIFNLYIILTSLRTVKEIQYTNEEILAIDNVMLPVYSILCPLYKEAHIVPQFINAIEQLDYPKDKLDVLFLLEADDIETILAIKAMSFPSYIRIILVPHSLPKTKPKACNYGLLHARGEYLVIYDAEDIPDPLQLKKAFLGFKYLPEKVVCLQAKLNYYNTRQNLLTRFFTAEYSLWFDLTLTGLQSIKASIPLGGTSNHFKINILKELRGWDPFNVTEDADLGIRLFKKGYQTAIIESTTLEEANSNVKNWIRQRSRWIKGYMQTYLVHTRESDRFIRDKGIWQYFVFHLTIGGKILFILLNPLMWVLTVLYFTQYQLIGSFLETIYQPPVSYLAVFSCIFGNFLFFYYYMIGCAKRNQWDLMKYIFFIPFYWLLMSISGSIALYQLLFKPHYWEKTVHGLHLVEKNNL